jgi:hypothetical protein
MIRSEAQLEQARTALTRVENALAALRARVASVNRALFEAMAEDYRSDIRELRREIETYLGVVPSSEVEVPLWMTLEGEELSSQDISSRLLSEWLGNFRKALYGVAAYLNSGRLKLGGRPEAALLYATDPHIVALSSGSIRVGLRLPDDGVSASPGSLNEETIAHRALSDLMAVAEWASSERVDLPRDSHLSPEEISVAARFASRLAPSPRSVVQTVTFSGSRVPSRHSLSLRAESRQRLQGLVKVLSHVAEMVATGYIREIDFDAMRVTLRDRGDGLTDLRCQLSADTIGVAERLLKQRVRVRGLVSSTSPDVLTVREITAAPAP